MNCLLCSSSSQKHEISFWKCLNCELIFKGPGSFPDFDSEKARYETHNNDGADPNYLKYLDKLFTKTGFKKGDVLDYGCGPSQSLSALVDSKNLSEVFVESYDPIFFKSADLNKKYDLVFASESFEHFFDPAGELKKILDLLKPNGVLAISTEFHDEHNVKNWWYARDPTHVVFYGVKTFEMIVRQYELKKIFISSPHVLLQKQL